MYWPRCHTIGKTRTVLVSEGLQDPNRGFHDCLSEVCGSFLCRWLHSLTFASPYRRINVQLWTDMLVAYNQIEKGLLLITYVWKSPKSSSPGQFGSPAQPTTLMSVIRGRWIRIFGVMKWLLWQEGQHCVIITLIWKKGELGRRGGDEIMDRFLYIHTYTHMLLFSTIGITRIS